MFVSTTAIFVLCTAMQREIGMRIVANTKLVTSRSKWTLWALRVRGTPATRRHQCCIVFCGAWILQLVMVVGVCTPNHVGQFIGGFSAAAWDGQKRLWWWTCISEVVPGRCWWSSISRGTFCEITGNKCGACANPLDVVPTNVKVSHSTCAPKLNCCNVVGLSCFLLCAFSIPDQNNHGHQKWLPAKYDQT